ncbi:hypothetical protein SGPA1_21773 [Streptomyces misionensis JCM 4497]
MGRAVPGPAVGGAALGDAARRLPHRVLAGRDRRGRHRQPADRPPPPRPGHPPAGGRPHRRAAAARRPYRGRTGRRLPVLGGVVLGGGPGGTGLHGVAGKRPPHGRRAARRGARPTGRPTPPDPAPRAAAPARTGDRSTHRPVPDRHPGHPVARSARRARAAPTARRADRQGRCPPAGNAFPPHPTARQGCEGHRPSRVVRRNGHHDCPAVSWYHFGPPAIREYRPSVREAIHALPRQRTGRRGREQPSAGPYTRGPRWDAAAPAPDVPARRRERRRRADAPPGRPF